MVLLFNLNQNATLQVAIHLSEVSPSKGYAICNRAWCFDKLWDKLNPLFEFLS